MTGRSIATLLFVLATAMYIAGVVLVALAGEPFTLNELILPVVYAFAGVGYLIARNRPGNAIAWISLGIGLVWGLEATLNGAAAYGLSYPGTIPWPEALAAIGIPLWVPGIFGIGTFVFMFFPDGRLPSPRWRWLPWTAGMSIALSYILIVLSEPETFGYGRPAIENPFAQVLGPWLEAGGFLAEMLDVFLTVVTFAAIGGSITALVIRYVRSRGIERHQLKWLVTAGSAAVVLQVISIFAVDYLGETVGLVAAMFFALIPVSIGIAVLRYRLYDIDRLLSRTVSYALVVGLLLVVFASVTIGIPQVLGIDRDEPLLVAVATLAAAALFNPVRLRIQAVVDRRFNRARYDAQQEVDRLAERLRSDLALDDLTGEVLGVVTRTMQPRTSAVWIRGDA